MIRPPCGDDRLSPSNVRAGRSEQVGVSPGVGYAEAMDPVTHALLGAAVGRIALQGAGRRSMLVGAAAGMLADADVLMRLAGDPALPWEMHRHVTHALAFAPVGGLAAALPFLAWAWWRQRWRATLLAATLAYATHGPLDACTSYGTHLWLPFSAERVSWDIIAIVDPFFTAILAAGLIWAARRNRAAPALVAVLLCAAYLGLGARQHGAALAEVVRTAETRGPSAERARAMPTPGNLVLWRGLYLSGKTLYADAVRVPILGSPRLRAGTSVSQFGAGDLDDLAGASPQRDRISDVLERLGRFSDGYIARDPRHPDIVADMRYSLETAAFAPLWGIRVDATATDEPVTWVELITDRRASLRRMWNELWHG